MGASGAGPMEKRIIETARGMIGPTGANCYTRRLRFTCTDPLMATTTKAKKKTVRIASGLKRVRQDVKLNAANTALRSKFRTVIKNVQKAVVAGDKAKATEVFQSAQKVIDSVADKGLFHKNKAARHKSRLSAKLKSLGAS
jgi:small subunit ribosomal protein S20